VEREIPGAGQWTPDQLRRASQKSVDVLKSLGLEIQWLESYVSDDKVYCVYITPNADLIREHAARSGFPVDRISRIHAVLDPTSADG
jgi:hypothetical protein